MIGEDMRHAIGAGDLLAREDRVRPVRGDDEARLGGLVAQVAAGIAARPPVDGGDTVLAGELEIAAGAALGAPRATARSRRNSSKTSRSTIAT